MLIEFTIDLHSEHGEYVWMLVFFIAPPVITNISFLNIVHVSRKALINNIKTIVSLQMVMFETNIPIVVILYFKITF